MHYLNVTLSWYVWIHVNVEPCSPAPASFIESHETWHPYEVPF